MRVTINSIFLLISLALINSTVTAQDLEISDGNIFDGEPYLAINPSNPQHMIVAWMGFVPQNNISIKSKTTFDGGMTWSSETVIPHEFSGFGTTTADPSIEFDNMGNVFLCYVDYNVLNNVGAVFVRKSTNGGMSWEAPVEVININADGPSKPADRPWMKIDRSSGPSNGNIYVTTMSPKVFGFIPPPYHPYFIRSTDGGASFEPWKYLDATNWLAGSLIQQPTPFPTVTEDGTFHCVYPSWVLVPRYIMATTTDGGNTFTHSLISRITVDQPVTDPNAKKGFPLISDPSDNDHLVFLSLYNIHGDSDVFMVETYDGGGTWSDPIRINDDPIGNDRMQDMIWGDFDDDGDFIVTWRDRRNGVDSTYETASEIWGAIRLKDSQDFADNFRLSDNIAPYDSVLASGGNDFMCVVLQNDTINAVWGDTRNGDVSIWFKRMSIDGTIVSVNKVSSTPQPQIDVYPNPSASSIFVRGEDLQKLVLMNQKGKLISEQVNLSFRNESQLDLSQVPKGIYFLQVDTSKGSVTKKIVKQ